MSVKKGKTIRTTLGKRSNKKIMLDMEEIYSMLDSGMTVTQVAKNLGCCRATIYERHKEYQDEIKKEMEKDEFTPPPLPPELNA